MELVNFTAEPWRVRLELARDEDVLMDEWVVVAEKEGSQLGHVQIIRDWMSHPATHTARLSIANGTTHAITAADVRAKLDRSHTNNTCLGFTFARRADRTIGTYLSLRDSCSE